MCLEMMMSRWENWIPICLEFGSAQLLLQSRWGLQSHTFHMIVILTVNTFRVILWILCGRALSLTCHIPEEVWVNFGWWSPHTPSFIFVMKFLVNKHFRDVEYSVFENACGQSRSKYFPSIIVIRVLGVNGAIFVTPFHSNTLNVVIPRVANEV